LLQCSTFETATDFFHEVIQCCSRRAQRAHGAPVLDPRYRPPELSFRTVRGREYRVAHWRANADTGAPPLLFFTGIGASIELLTPFLEMVGGRDIVTFDVPGIGMSPPAKWPYRPRKIAKTADAILRQLGFTGPVDVMGVSWGGMMAQQYAKTFRRKTRSLILAATTAGFFMVPPRWSALKHMSEPRRHVDPAYIRQHMEELYGGRTEELPDFFAGAMPPTRKGYFHQLLAIWGWTSLWFLPFLKVRTLILTGEDDRLVPLPNGYILRALIPGAKLEILPGEGHLFLLTERERMVGRVEEFLDAPG